MAKPSTFARPRGVTTQTAPPKRPPSTLPARVGLGVSAIIVAVATIVALAPGLGDSLGPLVGGAINLPVLGASGAFLAFTLMIAFVIGVRNQYRPPQLPQQQRVTFNADLHGLHVEKIMEKEFDYAAGATEQAMEHRMTIVNFYLLIGGGIASGVLALVGSSNNRTLSVAATPLLWIVSLIGGLIMLQLIALRRAWAGSVMEMNYIKEFFLANAEHFAQNELQAAFLWNPHSLPETHKRGTVYHYSGMLIALLDVTAFLGGTFLLGLSQRAELLQPGSLVVLAIFGILLFQAHMWLYDLMLIPRSNQQEAPRVQPAPQPAEAAPIAIQPTSYDASNPAHPNEVTNTRTIFQGRVVTLRVDDIRQPDGTASVREVVEHAPAVVVVAHHAADDTLLFIEQYRDAVGASLLELPAGLVEVGEDHAVTARRELLEETGYEAGQLRYLGSFFTSPGFTDEQLHLYLATELNRLSGIQDTHEIHALHHISRMEAMTLIESGTIRDGKTILGIIWSAPHLPTQV